MQQKRLKHIHPHKLSETVPYQARFLYVREVKVFFNEFELREVKPNVNNCKKKERKTGK